MRPGSRTIRETGLHQGCRVPGTRRAFATAVLGLSLAGTGAVLPVSATASTPRIATAVPAGPQQNHVKAAAYPYAHANPDGVDPWGASFRQCTSYASWWLTSHGSHISASTVLTGPRGRQALGDAGNWDNAAHRDGYVVNHVPSVGSIAQWHSRERSTWKISNGTSYLTAGPEGHVGVVRAVYGDGTVEIQDFNGTVSLGLGTFRGRAPRYLHIGVK